MVTSLTCRGLLSTWLGGSPKTGFPCRRGDGLPNNSAVWTWEGGSLLHKYVTRSWFLTSVWTHFLRLLFLPAISQILTFVFNASIHLRNFPKALGPVYLSGPKLYCWIQLQPWEYKSFSGSWEKNKRQANHNHNKKQSIRLYKLVYIQFMMWFYQLFLKFKQQSKWTS